MFPDPPASSFGQRHRAMLPEVRELIAALEARRLRVAWQRRPRPDDGKETAA